MNRFKDFAYRHVWGILGFLVVLFVFLSLNHNRVPGQLCLIAALGCAAVAQVDRYTAASRREAILGVSAVVLAVVGLVLVWPREIGSILLHFLEGLAAIRG